jgi:NADH:ubiquinone oxidoreductase subunit D
MIALETAEDVAAFALEGDDMDTLRKEFSSVVEKVRCVTKVAPGCRIADLVAIISTLDFVIPDIDR